MYSSPHSVNVSLDATGGAGNGPPSAQTRANREREGSPSHTAELRLVDVVSTLSRLEVQMAKDIDTIRHAQVTAQLKGGVVGGGGRSSSQNHSAAPSSIFPPIHLGGGGGSTVDVTFGAEVESMGEMSVRSLQAPLAPFPPLMGVGAPTFVSVPAAGGVGGTASSGGNAPHRMIPKRIMELRASR